MEDKELRRDDIDEMTDEEIMEKIRQDMNDIEVPDSISPLRMRQKLKSVKPDRKLVKFNRHRMNMASRVVAACFVGIVAIGAGTVAFMENQNAVKSTEGVAMTSDASVAAFEEDDCVEVAAAGLDTIGSLTRANSYEEIFAKFHEQVKDSPLYGAGNKNDGGMVFEEATDGAYFETNETVSVDSTADVAGVSQAEKESGYYTDTILQHEGVAEGDTIKTDGRYIYVLKSDLDQIYIIDAHSMEEKSVIDFYVDKSDRDNYEYISLREFYLREGKLYVVYQKRTGRNWIEPLYDYAAVDEGDLVAVKRPYIDGYSNVTYVATYDVSDATNPVLKNTLSQKGLYQTSRMIGNRFYLMTNEHSYNYCMTCDIDEAVKQENLDKWLPTVNDCPVEADDIYYKDRSTSYQCISAFDMTDYSTIDSKVIYDSFAQFYMTTDNLYVYETKWEDDFHYLEDYSYDGNYDNYYKVSTEITRFDISSGNIIAVANNTFDGSISDTFAIRENGDFLYLIMDVDEKHYKDSWKASESKDWTNLYVCDKNLNVISSLTEIAPKEQVYSARFVGNIGYFVTYRNMDPLFTVDLSNPRVPKLIGELEIPGFSDYLHPWGDHNLIGIGEERDEGSNFIGIKISLYDTTDPTDVKEVDKLVIDADESSALYNYKELLCDYNINLAGFSAISYNWNDDDYDWEVDESKVMQNGYVFKVLDNKIVMDATIPLNEGNEYYSWGSSRMLYIDNYLYVTDDNCIRKLDCSHGYSEEKRFTFPEVSDWEYDYPIVFDDVYLD